jgi:hypothetical protein
VPTVRVPPEMARVASNSDSALKRGMVSSVPTVTISGMSNVPIRKP